MKSSLIVHGKPTRERYENPDIPKPHEANWLPWLSASLERRGISTFVPAMPRPYVPDYNAWREELGSTRIDSTTSLVGHSAGAEFLLRLLSTERLLTAEQLVLVAPYADSARKYGNFSEYNLDKSIGRRVGRVVILNSTDDSRAIQDNAQRLARAIPEADLVELDGFGHFMLGNNMQGPEFPELLNILGIE